MPMYMYMSLILSDNLAPPNTAHTAKTSQKVATAESSFPTSSVIPASGAFNEAVFHGGHSNITINTLNKSPKTSKCSVSTVARSYKRIKRALDSSDEEALPGGGSHVARLNFKTSRVGVY